MTTEELFNGGMKHVASSQPEGFVKSLVNFDIKDNGETLVPRGGLKTLQESIATIYGMDDTKDYIIHHAGSTFIQTADLTDALLCKYFLFGKSLGLTFELTTAVMCIEYQGNFYSAPYTGSGELTATLHKPLSEIHKVPISNTFSREGIFTSLEGNTYIPTSDGIGFIEATFNEAKNGFTWTIKKLEPKDVKATQAINYGYNMLKDKPYEFTNQSTAVGSIVLDGIIPRDSQRQLMLSARPGAEVYFHLVYQYPEADKTNGRRYYVQWEMQDLNTDSAPDILQQVRRSPAYTPGQDIYIRTASTTLKEFSLTAKIYYKDVVDAAEYDTNVTPEIGDSVFLAPEQVLTLASYYFTNDNNSNTLNRTTVNYDLTTATGMTTWQQRLVLWGVKDAKTTLFVSEINQPEYMPYPNNAEVFSDNIIACVPYMSNLLLFTETKLYTLTMNDDGLTYSTKVIQERLSMTEEDYNTITVVQNMVYFKSGNTFYMVVPNAKAGPGELQLAPVTRPVEKIIDNFNKVIPELIDDVYNLGHLYDLTESMGDSWEVELFDYCNYLDNSQMHNVYKYLITIRRRNPETNVIELSRRYLDVSMNYDTMLRTWTVYMSQANKYRMLPYNPSVTQNTIYINMTRQVGKFITVDTLQRDNNSPKDEFRLETVFDRELHNYQYLDTGYRKHSDQYKKRFREIQLMVNNSLGSKLKFYTGFVVDDDVRKSIYKHTVQHITEEEDPNYGLVFVERTMADPEIVPDKHYLTTPEVLSNELTLDDGWELDFSRFPNLTVVKVRFRVSGKGYGGSVKLLSMNEEHYELLNINWVYRTMFAR